MRITIAHEKGQKEAMRIIDRSAADLVRSIPAGPVKIVDPEKTWKGNIMSFSFKGKMGFFESNNSRNGGGDREGRHHRR